MSSAWANFCFCQDISRKWSSWKAYHRHTGVMVPRWPLRLPHSSAFPSSVFLNKWITSPFLLFADYLPVETAAQALQEDTFASTAGQALSHPVVPVGECRQGSLLAFTSCFMPLQFKCEGWVLGVGLSVSVGPSTFPVEMDHVRTGLTPSRRCTVPLPAHCQGWTERAQRME